MGLSSYGVIKYHKRIRFAGFLKKFLQVSLKVVLIKDIDDVHL